MVSLRMLRCSQCDRRMLTADCVCARASARSNNHSIRPNTSLRTRNTTSYTQVGCLCPALMTMICGQALPHLCAVLSMCMCCHGLYLGAEIARRCMASIIPGSLLFVLDISESIQLPLDTAAH